MRELFVTERPVELLDENDPEGRPLDEIMSSDYISPSFEGQRTRKRTGRSLQVRLKLMLKTPS